jgi:hypothetical protein
MSIISFEGQDIPSKTSIFIQAPGANKSGIQTVVNEKAF